MTMMGTTNSSGRRRRQRACRLPNVLGLLLAKNRPIVMGILNVTPDSFSDGGQFDEPEIAFQHARQMIEQGADIIDIGAESTRPYGGAKPVTLEEELARLQPVLPTVVQMGVPVSIDTIKPEVAFWALGQGVRLVNDVWGLQRDPNMAVVVAQHDVPVVIMHNRYKAESDDQHRLPTSMRSSTIRSTSPRRPASGATRSCSIPASASARRRSRAWRRSPGLQNFKHFGLPILIGASRKRFINTVSPSEPMDRVGGSIAAHVMAYINGADDHPDPRCGRNHPGAPRDRRPPGHQMSGQKRNRPAIRCS